MKPGFIFIYAIATVAIVAASVLAQDKTGAETLPGSPALAVATPADDSPASPIRPASLPGRDAHVVSFRRNGFWVTTENGDTHVQVHGYVQADNRMFSANTRGEGLDTFAFRRIRPLLEGTLFNQIDFRFMPDFGQYTPQIQEAYLELKSPGFAKLRVGKFKEPIGLEVLRSDRDLSFTERSLASDLLPLRYIGAQLSSSFFGDSVEYAAGYFDGSSDGSNGVFTQWTRGNEAAARVFLQPFATTNIEAIRRLGVGIAGSAGAQHGAIAALKTMGQTTFFKYSSGTVADGQHNRLAPQAYYYAGPVGLIGEYAISSQEVQNKTAVGRIKNESWQISGSIVLTGERNTYNAIRPRKSFEPTRSWSHWGAVELAVRYSQLRIDNGAFAAFANGATAAQTAKERGIALNWYLNSYVKLVTNYEHTSFRMATPTTPPLHDENVLISRVQLAF